MNFCSFALTRDQKPSPDKVDPPKEHGILIAVPGVHDGHINVTSLPSEDRIATIPTPEDIKTGMVMALRLHFHPQNNQLLVVAGYESGHCCVWKLNPLSAKWQPAHTYKAHAQPVLSLDIVSAADVFYSSSADAIIARHPLAETGSVETKLIQTKHAGQQSLAVRSDEKIFATAGWDGRMRVYSVKTMKEVAVLKWHKEGCYALAFAHIEEKSREGDGDIDHDQQPDGTIVKRELTVSQRRIAKARSTHWLAAGSKDGKISLWDIY